MKDLLTGKFNELSSDTKKKLVLVLILVIALPILFTFLNGGAGKSSEGNKPVIRDALLGTRTNDIGINALANKLNKESRTRMGDKQEIQDRLDRIEQSLDLRDDSSQKQSHRLKTLLRKTISELDTRKVEMDRRLEAQVQILDRQRMEFEKRLGVIEVREPSVITLAPNIPNNIQPSDRPVDTGPKTFVNAPSQTPEQVKIEERRSSQEAVVQDDWEIFEGAMTSGFGDPSVDNSFGQSRGGSPNQEKISSTFVTLGVTGEENDGSKSAVADPDPTHYLAAGAIIRGTLLSGMDAPTYDVASARPYPVTLRVKHDAILPNNRRMDLKECFIIGSGFGDLSSERAMIRGELLSCINSDGGVIEVPLDSYAVGSDGKLGVRGRLVSKQGQILAAAMKAGFISGIAQAFSPRQQFSSNQNDTSGEVNYQFPNAGDVATVGITSGASSALSKLAEFYMKMAEKIFPIIEIDGGRTVTFITNRGIELKLKRG